MIRAGDYVLPVPLDDPRPVATCIRVARVGAGLVELEGDGAPEWREDGTRLNPAAPCQRLLRCEGRYCLNGRHTEERRAGAS